MTREHRTSTFRRRYVMRGSDVTVLIVTIPGREEMLHRAVESVAAQTIKPARVVVGRDKERLGAATARNKALEQVKTEWVAILDDDDEFLPDHLRTLIRGANLSGADLIFSYPEFVGGRDPLACLDDNGTLVPEPINIPFGPVQEYGLRKYGNFIPCTVLVRTALVRQVGGYPEPYSMPEVTVSADCEDYLLLLRLLDAGASFYHVTGVRTWRYTYHDGNLGGRGVNRMHEIE
jgi:glycosyltransferase involved in cell wall biosynthesis